MPISKKNCVLQDSDPEYPFFVVYNFMLAGALRLTGLHLSIFAIIFSYWLSGKTMYASNSHLADYLSCRRETVNRTLSNLVQRHLVQRLADPTESGAWCYTIDESTLCEKVTGWCDFISHLRVTNNHTPLCDNVTGECDINSPNNTTVDNIDKKIRDKEMRPLPLICNDDAECVILWDIVCRLPRWKGRSPEALAVAAKVLEGYPVELCRAMLRHTIAGSYAEIYPPTKDMIVNNTALCDKKSHHRPMTVEAPSDDDVFRRLSPFFPNELKDQIYLSSNGSGQRGLKFLINDGQVDIACTPKVHEWLTSIHETLNPILAQWAGGNYTGYTFIHT